MYELTKTNPNEERTKKRLCCLCGQYFIGWGNNPWPLNNDPDAVCCNECNDTRVVPARIQQMSGNGR